MMDIVYKTSNPKMIMKMGAYRVQPPNIIPHPKPIPNESPKEALTSSFVFLIIEGVIDIPNITALSE